MKHGVVTFTANLACTSALARFGLVAERKTVRAKLAFDYVFEASVRRHSSESRAQSERVLGAFAESTHGDDYVESLSICVVSASMR